MIITQPTKLHVDIIASRATIERVRLDIFSTIPSPRQSFITPGCVSTRRIQKSKYEPFRLNGFSRNARLDNWSHVQTISAGSCLPATYVSFGSCASA